MARRRIRFTNWSGRARSEWQRIREDHTARGSTREVVVARVQDLLSITPLVAGVRVELEEVRRHVRDRDHQLIAQSSALATENRRLRAEVRDLRRLLNVWTVGEWLTRADVDPPALVSVVLATRNRSRYLERAIGSVRAQTHPRWDLVVVDDASTDRTPVVLRAAGGDDRVRTLRTDGVGCCAARNIGLAAARGELIAYLDDDNMMHPDWLRAVAWAFEHRPDVDVLYGARIIDDFDRAHRIGEGGLPWLQFLSYSRRRLELGNIADTNVLAHRAGLPEAHFDEGLAEFGDWDLLLRLTRDRPPLELPALACCYTTDAPRRLSGHDDGEAEMQRVRAKAGR